MEKQLKQLVLFESGEMLFSWVNSEDHICLSTEREAKHAIASNRIATKIDVRHVEFCNLSVFMTGYSHVVLSFNVVSSHLFAWRVSFVLGSIFPSRSPIADRLTRFVTSKSVSYSAPMPTTWPRGRVRWTLGTRLLCCYEWALLFVHFFRKVNRPYRRII